MSATPIRVIKTPDPANCCTGECSQGRECPNRRFNVGMAGAILANVILWICLILLVSVVLQAVE